MRPLLGVLVIGATALAADWVTPLAKARDRARATGRPLFVYVYDSV